MPQIIPVSVAVLCVNCGVVSDATGEECPGCAGTGALLNLSTLLTRTLNSSKET